MKTIIKLITISIVLLNINGCASSKSQSVKVTKATITEKECKEMLGEKTYQRLNELYGDKSAAMTQCLIRLEKI